jgi:hypothetical protein
MLMTCAFAGILEPVMKLVRFVAVLLPLAMLLGASTAQANYISTGSQGAFEPTASTVLDLSSPVFNFTDIIIPEGVTVSFAGLAAAQPIELLATGTVSIAGIINASAYSLWIGTPGAITMTGGGVIYATNLTLDAGTIALTGGSGGAVTISSGGGGGSSIVGGSGAITISGGGGSIIGGDCTLAGGGCTLVAVVPEPDSEALFVSGLAILAAVGCRQRSRRALLAP